MGSQILSPRDSLIPPSPPLLTRVRGVGRGSPGEPTCRDRDLTTRRNRPSVDGQECSSVRQRNIHPTRDALITAATGVLETRAPEDVKVDEILAASGISSGSLYHHFRDLSDLIDHAMIARFANYSHRNIDALVELTDKARDRESLSELFRAYIASQAAPDRADARTMRAQVVARATHDERFRALFLAEQDRVIGAVADLAREFQSRGLVDSTLDPTAIAVFFGIYNIGLVINDLLTDPASPDDLLTLMSGFIDRVIID
jgi:AcrR family transcriptional regulator